MNTYETIFVLKAGTEEENGKRADFVKDLIKKNGGTITKDELWGEKSFYHDMNKEPKGIYLKIDYTIDGQKIVVMEKECNLSSDVLRTMVIKRDK